MSTLSLYSAAKKMNIHTNTMMRLIHEGVIPAAKIGRAYVLLEKDVMAYVDAQIAKQTAERRGLTRA